MTDLMSMDRTAPQTAETALVGQVSAYWASLRGADRAPARRSIDPRALGPALPHVFLAQLVTPRMARLRIVGHRIEALLDMDMRGMSLSVLFSGAARDELGAALMQVARGVRVTLALQGPDATSARLALLPLTDDAGQITRLLGVLETDGGRPGAAPCRFTRAAPVAPAAARRQPPVLRVITGGRA